MLEFDCAYNLEISNRNLKQKKQNRKKEKKERRTAWAKLPPSRPSQLVTRASSTPWCTQLAAPLTLELPPGKAHGQGCLHPQFVPILAPSPCILQPPAVISGAQLHRSDLVLASIKRPAQNCVPPLTSSGETKCVSPEVKFAAGVWVVSASPSASGERRGWSTLMGGVCGNQNSC